MKISLKDNERIRQIYRQTPVILIHSAGVALVGIILVGYLIIRFSARGILLGVLAAIIVFLLGYALKKFMIWRLNQYVVTNQRLLYYAHTGLFSQSVTETPHERILNVSYKHEGIFSALFGYGDVIVQIVGLMDPIVIKNISEPMEIKDYLWEMHKRIAKDQGGVVYASTDATHLQEQVGYTKQNHSE